MYEGGKDKEHLKHMFCGKAAESVTSATGLVYIRFYAEKNGIKNSKFVAISTEIRELKKEEKCDLVRSYNKF